MRFRLLSNSTLRPARLPAVCLVLVALMALTGCGYTLVGKASNIPDDVRRVFVEPLVNETARTQVEQFLTRAILDEMVTRRRFEVVNSASDADGVLRGRVTSFQARPLTFDDSGLANSFEIRITTDMRFERTPTTVGETEVEVIWSNARYSFKDDYPVAQAGLTFLDRENLAIEETSESFAETLITDLLEGF